MFNKVPSWAQVVLKNQEKIMAAIDDLNTAVATLTTTISTLITNITTALANDTSSTAVETAVTSLNALNAQLVAESNTITGASVPTPVSVTPPASS
jgi:hypothetical protein